MKGRAVPLFTLVIALTFAGRLASVQPPAAGRGGAPQAPGGRGGGNEPSLVQFIGPRPLISGLHGVVTSNHPLATAAGMRILLKGGNAFDAAVATAAATSVVDPGNSSLGGNGFATIYIAATKEVKTLNFFGTAPMAAKPSLYTQEKLNEGILASPIPSNLRGYQELLQKHGTMKLAEVLEPAIELAEKGYLVTPEFARMIERTAPTFKKYPTSANVYLPGGQAPKAGSLFVQADYARTLKQVAAKGADDFYSGDLARRIADFYKQQGGLITLEDLRNYQAKWVTPISITYHGHTIYTQPPNSSAIAALEQLNIMEGFDVKALQHDSAPYLHRFMEAVRMALADRNKYVADSDAVVVPIAQLLSKSYAERQRARINPDRAMPVVTPSEISSQPQGDTTNIAVADAAGNMVALTQTLGGGFGSTVIVADTGLFFSNQMRHMHLDPESPSQVRGGARPRSNQTPTIIVKDGVAIAALGSPGNDAIWQRVAQATVNLIDFGMNMQDAVSASRFAYGGPDETGTSVTPVWLVESRIPNDVVEKLKSMGHEIRTVPTEGGAVTGVTRDPVTKMMTAGADPRGRSYAMGW
jgi:gamma-glutamyltranspeptidase / glutathione hydrolase